MNGKSDNWALAQKAKAKAFHLGIKYIRQMKLTAKDSLGKQTDTIKEIKTKSL